MSMKNGNGSANIEVDPTKYKEQRTLRENNGLWSDARLCTRKSMPILFDRIDQHTVIDESVQQKVLSLMEKAKNARRNQISGQSVSENDKTEYVNIIAEIGTLIMKHVPPDSPCQMRKLFNITDPAKQWLLRSNRTRYETFAWLDETAVRNAVHQQTDVQRNSIAPLF